MQVENLKDDLAKILNSDPLSIQIGGDHYTKVGNPIELISLIDNHFGFAIATACKYVVRCRYKNSLVQDLTKAVHYMALHKALLEKECISIEKMKLNEFNKAMRQLAYLELEGDLEIIICLLLDWGASQSPVIENKILDKIVAVASTEKSKD